MFLVIVEKYFLDKYVVYLYRFIRLVVSKGYEYIIVDLVEQWCKEKTFSDDDNVNELSFFFKKKRFVFKVKESNENDLLRRRNKDKIQ